MVYHRHVSGMVTKILAVAAGGALGAVGRYLVSGWTSRLAPGSSFPWGTLAVNVSGAFVLGIVMAATTSGRLSVSPLARTFVTIGLLGAFTTFSTFSYETLEALRVRHWGVGIGNIAASLALGLAACWIGLAVGDRL